METQKYYREVLKKLRDLEVSMENISSGDQDPLLIVSQTEPVSPADGLLWYKPDLCLTTTTTTEEPALKILYDGIVNVPVADPSSVSDWNTLFDLPTYGTPFTSVTVNGDEISLFGGANISIKDGIFSVSKVGDVYLLSITDEIGCITELQDFCFCSCTSATSFSLPSLTTAGDVCFNSCSSTTSFSLPALLNLGTTTGQDYVFYDISGNTITLTIPIALTTCDGGNPDGDIVYLDNNNDLTIITV